MTHVAMVGWRQAPVHQQDEMYCNNTAAARITPDTVVVHVPLRSAVVVRSDTQHARNYI